MEYYSALNKEIVTLATTQMNLEARQKRILYDSSLLQTIKDTDVNSLSAKVELNILIFLDCWEIWIQ